MTTLSLQDADAALFSGAAMGPKSLVLKHSEVIMTYNARGVSLRKIYDLIMDHEQDCEVGYDSFRVAVNTQKKKDAMPAPQPLPHEARSRGYKQTEPPRSATPKASTAPAISPEPQPMKEQSTAPDPDTDDVFKPRVHDRPAILDRADAAQKLSNIEA